MNELIVINDTNALTLFTTANGLDPVIADIKARALGTERDASTPEGRQIIKSLAHEIAKAKNDIDRMAKSLTADWKQKAKLVDKENGRAWDDLEAFQKEIRAPLTDWEGRDKVRTDAHENRIKEITEAGTHSLQNWQTLSVEAMTERLAEIGKETNWEEFAGRGNYTVKTSMAQIKEAIEKRAKHDEEQAELARLRKEEAERKQKEHDERVASEAAIKAKLEATAKAKAEADALAEKVKIEQEKAEKERLRIVREKEESEAKAKKSEDDRIAAESRAAQAAKDAETKLETERLASEERAKQAKIQADKEVEAAAKRERDRIEAERRAEVDAAAKREADKAHKTKINREALHALLSAVTKNHIANRDEAEKLCKTIIEAIAKGQVPHIKISY